MLQCEIGPGGNGLVDCFVEQSLHLLSGRRVWAVEAHDSVVHPGTENFSGSSVVDEASKSFEKEMGDPVVRVILSGPETYLVKRPLCLPGRM